MDFTTDSLRSLMFSEDWGKEVEMRMSETMERLYEIAFNGELEDGTPLDEFVSPSGNPYCGCQDCMIRELTYLAMQLALEGHARGLIELVWNDTYAATGDPR